MTLYLQERQEHIRSRRERRKLARRARIRRQIVRYLFLSLLLGAAAAGFLCLSWTLADADRDIQVEGNQVVTVEQVRGALANFVGKPIYRLDPQLLESRVRSLDAVRYAYVRRYFLPRPHLVVTVLEEFPWAAYSSNPNGPPEAVISETGRIIPLNEFPNTGQPEFRIYGPPGMKMTKSEVSQWASWVSYVASQTGRKIDYVDMRKPDCIWIQDGDLRLKAGAADSSLTRRLGRLASIVPALGEVHGQIDYIDLGLDNNIPLKVIKKDPRHPSQSKAGTAGGDSVTSQAGTAPTQAALDHSRI